MNRIRKKNSSYLISSLQEIYGIILFGLSLSGCIAMDNNLNSEANSPPSINDPDASGTPDAVAEDWSQLTMLANYAKTTLDTMAHFNTSRNACGKDAYGAIQSSGLWNQLVVSINEAVQSNSRSEESCSPFNQETDANGYYKKTMDGTVEVKLANGSKRLLFALRGSDICTTIQDPGLSKNLLSALNDLVLIADKEDCPNGWGSALEANHGRY
jgi:hypothetical protein